MTYNVGRNTQFSNIMFFKRRIETSMLGCRVSMFVKILRMKNKIEIKCITSKPIEEKEGNKANLINTKEDRKQ